ncbi:MAG TPA: sigma-70 family RNA polymerase sigma factor [Thermoanaerobaculia bacterium]|nr:sigma-70 family RNA polymerase sigma factor [Thermoanaerobaculia bacterium]
MSLTQREITALLAEWSDGDQEALERLMPLVFEELRQLARSQFRREPDGHTLQPTALVHEVYMRLAGQRKVEWQNRSQFFAFAALLMRRILVDHAKARFTAKRGGGATVLPLNEALARPGDDDGEATSVDLLALDQALEALAEVDPRQARIVELRFFAGLTHEEIAELLGISVTTVKRDWKTARFFLFRVMSGGE